MKVSYVAVAVAVCAEQLAFGAGSAEYPVVDDAKVAQILSGMTLREKLDETGISFFSEGDFDAWRFNPLDAPKLAPWPNPENWFDLKPNDRLGLRGLRLRDGPRGVTCLLGGVLSFGKPCPKDGSSPAFPHANLRASTWSTALEEEFGAATGEIAKLLDVHAALLPCINVLPWLNNGRSQEVYGEDPFMNGRMGAATVRGIQSKGVMATPKHFLANNIENTRWMVSANMDDKTLHEVYLRAWAMVVEESAPEWVMTSYNRVQGNWSNIDPKFLRLLRERLGFQGSVMTDWLATMNFAPEQLPNSPFKGKPGFFGHASTSLVAGVDLEMPFNTRHTAAVRELAACGAADPIVCETSNSLDKNVGHLIRSKLRYGLVGTSHPEASVAVYDAKRFDELALRIAHQGIVLLQNEGSFLPKKPKDVASVVVLGTPDVLELGDRGSSAQHPSGRVATVLDGLRAKYGGVRVAHLAAEEASHSQVAKADLVVLDVGFNHSFEGEYVPPHTGGDRQYLTLHPHELELIRRVTAVSSRVVVAITGGGPVLVEEFAGSVQAILWMGYPGPLGGQALADILAGDVNPSGRMTSATPRAPRDWVPEGITVTPWVGSEITYPYVYGFKHMWQAGIEPRFPMGWGLSYTTFSYAAPTLSAASGAAPQELTLTMEVANTGDREGIATVQAYAVCQSCQRKRLPILLVGFARVPLAAGTSSTVEIKASARQLAVYDVETGLWLLEKGLYRFLLGPCADAKQLQAVDYAVEADASFDYALATRPPHVPGTGERQCSSYRCAPDQDFVKEEAQAIFRARATMAVIAIGALLFSCCCLACTYRRLRACCCSSAGNKPKGE